MEISSPSPVSGKGQQRRQRRHLQPSESLGLLPGLRHLRRSSTGSTNTLRTYSDVNGFRAEKRSISSVHLFPTMFRNKSHANWDQTRRQVKQRKRNFEYAASSSSGKHGSTLEKGTSRSTPALFGDSDQAPGSSRVSYSILQEEQHLREKDRVNPGKGLSTKLADASPAGGLERCFQDVMGAACAPAQRIRDRLKVPPESSSVPESSTIPSSSTERERRALVIDDSFVIRKTVARALSKLGIQTVVQACDGIEGVQCMKEHAFEITLCDFSMPNMGGIDCVKEYRRWETQQAPSTEKSLRPKQYIVGMSAHASPGDIAQGVKVGMNEYQPKPLTIKKLGELLESSPVRATRMQLDVWEKGDQSVQPSTNLASTFLPNTTGSRAQPKVGLFDDFTSATLMMDAMSGSGRSAAPRHQTESGASKKAKTTGLFSLA